LVDVECARILCGLNSEYIILWMLRYFRLTRVLLYNHDHIVCLRTPRTNIAYLIT